MLTKEIELIFMSHGHLSEEMLASTHMIIGDLAVAKTLAMEAEDGLAGTQAKLAELLPENNQQPVLILADLKGGTPCNVGMLAMKDYPNLRVVSGLNLAMAIEACVATSTQVDELAEYLQQIGKEAVLNIPSPTITDDDEEYEE
ncbi:PTS sugar transporter subunit IIA [Vagococcus humatus]|nr:PTS fructose transporter subunit IIA [Vagococcus humatus]